MNIIQVLNSILLLGSEFPKMMLYFKSDILFAEGLPFQPFDSQVGTREQWPKSLDKHRILLEIVERLSKSRGEPLDAAARAFFVGIVAGVDQRWLAWCELTLHAIQSGGKQSA
jgi:hypothetical protein